MHHVRTNPGTAPLGTTHTGAASPPAVAPTMTAAARAAGRCPPRASRAARWAATLSMLVTGCQFAEEMGLVTEASSSAPPPDVFGSAGQGGGSEGSVEEAGASGSGGGAAGGKKQGTGPSAGQGSSKGVGACATADDCPASASACMMPHCQKGTCVELPLPAGTTPAKDTQGDCRHTVCDGKGNAEATPDDADTPLDDGNPCTIERCEKGHAAAPEMAPIGTPCGQGFCSTSGACSACTPGQTVCLDGSLVATCTDASTWGPPKSCPITTSPVCGTNSCEAIVGIVAGGSHTCAWLEGGTARCWGGNWAGQLGRDTVETTEAWPKPVVGLTGVVSMSAGQRHTCAIVGGGKMYCWGENDRGQLGLGNDATSGIETTVQSTPHLVANGNLLASRVAAGSGHTCALLLDGTVWCWGSNEHGQLGGLEDSPGVPVPVPNLVDVVELTAGDDHTCARSGSGKIRCWGRNNLGQLGTNGKLDSAKPLEVMGIGPLASIVAGPTHTCARFSQSKVRCWGSNKGGKIGSENGELVLTPTLPAPFVELPFVGVVAGGTMTCFWRAKSPTITCLGKNDVGQLNDLPPYPTASSPRFTDLPGPQVSLVAGMEHACALLENGRVLCWGANKAGQLGNGTYTAFAPPTPVAW